MRKNSQNVIDAYLAPPDVHEVQRERDRHLLLPFFAALIFTVLHGANIYGLLFEQNNFWFFLLCHVVLVAVSAVMARTRYLTGRDARLFTLLAVTSSVLGVFGAAGSLLCVMAYFWYRRKSQSFAEWFENICPPVRMRTSETVHEDIITGRDESTKPYSVIPFLDVLSIGSEAQKAQALSKMTLHFSPQFAPGFKTALQDESNLIRVQAATATTRIENQFLSRLMEIMKVRAEHPKDADVVLALAEHYDNYAYTGILDLEREHANRVKAMEHYREYLTYHPDDLEVNVRIGRLLLREDKNEEAAEWFAQCEQRGLTSDTLISWHLESLFRAGNFAELRRIIGKHNIADFERFRNTSPALVETLELWASQASGEVKP